MKLTKLPVEPYYVNAATWWIKNKNSDNNEFKEWLKTQGTTIENHESYYPWLDFMDPVKAVLFQIKWGK